MTISMYEASVPVFSSRLKALSKVLAIAEKNAADRKIDPQVFIGARLAPDMFALARQVQIATDHAKGAPSRLAGRDVPRDSDMQAAGLGEAFEPGADFSGVKRGDLVFWKGHVAIMTSDTEMIHASGHTMQVCREGLKQAVGRIGYLYGGPTGFRRP